jgi:hypothetical protein
VLKPLVATVALAGLLALPAAASASKREPKHYHGTVVVHQAPVPGTLPHGSSSASYRFHARYKVSGKKRRPPYGRKGAEYALIGRGSQALAYRADLNDTANPNNTHANVADWHGSGALTRHSGNVAVLDVTGKRFAFAIALLGYSGHGTIPLALSSQETDFFSDDTMSCTTRVGQSGSTLKVDDPCSSDFRSLTVPTSTSINPDVLLHDLPLNRVCRGTKAVVRFDEGFCGSAKGSGRIHRVYKTTISRPLDYPFNPWEDQDAAFDAQANAGLSYGSLGTWGELVIRTTFTVDLKPGK